MLGVYGSALGGRREGEDWGRQGQVRLGRENSLDEDALKGIQEALANTSFTRGLLSVSGTFSAFFHQDL